MTRGIGKINILFVLPNFDTGGSEKLVVDLVEHLDKSKFNPVVCVFFSGVYEVKMRELGVPFYCVHEGKKNRPKIEIIKFLNKIIRDHRIDIVNTHHTSPLAQGILSFKFFNRTRLVHTEHTRLDCYDFIKPRHILFLKWCLKYADLVLGISEGVCEYFKNELGVPERKIVKILNGVDVARFAQAKSAERRAKMRQDLGIDEKDVVIGLFANFRVQKNHGLLLRAVKLLRDRGIHNIKVVFAGAGPELENIKELADELNLGYVDMVSFPSTPYALRSTLIYFLGMRSDIPDLMNMIDIYCLPSHFEGLPISLIEAFAAGKQVVATNVDGNRDVIKEMGRGILVEPDNAEGLAKALLGSIENGVGKIEVQNNPSSIVDFPFSFNDMVKNYESLFQKLAVQKEG